MTRDGMDAGEERLGPYRLVEPLGRGGMGDVFRARDMRKRGRMVAIKRLPRRLAEMEEFRHRFRREAEIVASLNAPNVIPVHDYGEIDGHLYIEMRYVRGRDLATVLNADRRLTATRTARIVSQTAAALDAAHEAGLCHRDVKPANILLTGASGEDFVYLVDFGIARADLIGDGLTPSGALIGTPAYMAPERYQTAETSHLVDIYALGCVLFECLTGCKPFPAENAAAAMYAHLHHVVPRPSAFCPAVPTALDAVVAKAVGKNPDDRFARAGDLAYACRSAVASDQLAGAPTRACLPGDLPRPRTAPLTPLTDALERGRAEGWREVGALYERLAESGHPDRAPRALVNLGLLLARHGDVAAAKAAYLRAVDSAWIHRRNWLVRAGRNTRMPL